MIYKIISTGSDGNCTILNDRIAVDLGISYKKLGVYSGRVRLVLLTHEHSDHFNETTIRKLNLRHPAVKFVCLAYLAEKLSKMVPKASIYVLEPNKVYDLGICKVSAFNLYHDVPNCGWRIMIGDEKAIYATDTSKIDVVAKNYDLYLIEANYETTEIINRIAEKRMNGDYIYEYRAINNHLSKEDCDAFLEENKGPESIVEYMHRHKEKPNDEEVQIDNKQREEMLSVRS
ncbi:MAG: MBL fold metallo-hydrolase [Erysipelotrichaceae bacterium]|nr:MBL fold metallo-hydrolase [Erysipelotrichaceae bacterium]